MMNPHVAGHPGLVWREAVVETVMGLGGPSGIYGHKLDLNMDALARCAEQVYPYKLGYIERAAKAFAERETFQDALRRLVRGIDVQGDDGTWSIDRDALGHARRVLGIEGEGGA